MKESNKNVYVAKEKTPKSFYLLPVFFFLSILYLLAASFFSSHNSNSALNDQILAEKPKLSFESLVNGSYIDDYSQYIADQFWSRDNFVETYSMLEIAQSKIEGGDVWFAEDGYLIAQKTADTQAKLPQNIQAVCEFSSRFSGKVSIMIVPSPANMLSVLLPGNPYLQDENAMLDNMFSQFSSSGATVIDLRNAFAERQKQENDVFYKTDHHWTTTGGAYVAYMELCASLGIEPQPPSESLRVDVPGFLGSNYRNSLKYNTQPETLSYYDIPNTISQFNQNNDGSYDFKEEVSLMDKSKFETFDKYGAFLQGNNGYSEIKGNGSGSILIVKDSYANCFIPYLIANYEKIGVLDLRSWTALDNVISNEAYDEILLLYSFDAFSSDMFVYRMADAGQNI